MFIEKNSIINEMSNMVGIVKYPELKTFALGSYKGKVLQTKYQYKSNIFAVTENNYDFIVSQILQSVNRQESIIFMDSGNDLYKGTSAFFKRRSYKVYNFIQEDIYASDTLSLWEKAYDIDGLIDMAEYLLEPIWRHYISEDCYFALHDELINGIAGLLSYAISDARLKVNKYKYIYDLISDKDIETITQYMTASNDTSQVIWTGFLDVATDIAQDMEIFKSIFLCLAEPENNSMISFDSFDICEPSQKGTVVYIGNLSQYNAAANIVAYSILKNNIIYQEKTKNRGESINLIINHIEDFYELDYILLLFEYMKKYKMNIFISCGSIDTFTEKHGLKCAEKLLNCMQYIIIRNKINLDFISEYSGMNIKCQDLSDKNEKEILITDKKYCICDKYNTSKHRLYTAFYE